MSYVLKQKCLNCGKEYPSDKWIFKGCEACKTKSFVSNLVLIYDIEKISKNVWSPVLIIFLSTYLSPLPFGVVPERPQGWQDDDWQLAALNVRTTV